MPPLESGALWDDSGLYGDSRRPCGDGRLYGDSGLYGDSSVPPLESGALWDDSGLNGNSRRPCRDGWWRRSRGSRGARGERLRVPPGGGSHRSRRRRRGLAVGRPAGWRCPAGEPWFHSRRVALVRQSVTAAGVDGSDGITHPAVDRRHRPRLPRSQTAAWPIVAAADTATDVMPEPHVLADLERAR